MTLMVTVDSKLALVTSLQLFPGTLVRQPSLTLALSASVIYSSTLLGPHPGASSLFAALSGGIRWCEDRTRENLQLSTTYACVSTCTGKPEVNLMPFSGTITLILSQGLLVPESHLVPKSLALRP